MRCKQAFMLSNNMDAAGVIMQCYDLAACDQLTLIRRVRNNVHDLAAAAAAAAEYITPVDRVSDVTK